MAKYKVFESSAKFNFLALLFLFSLITGKASGQRTAPPSPHSHSVPAPPIEGHLNIVAVMAEFQSDDNPYTSGNGTFASGSLPYLDQSSVKIDPLPHNQPYFEAHLEFVKNYFERMSQGELEISYHVLPRVYQVPGTMADYSPTGRDPDLSTMATFAADVWSEVNNDESEPGPLPSHENTLYVIFHAGVGRDIELTGTSLNRTPQDLPSLYLDKGAYRDLLNDPSFSGFPFLNGEYLIDNTMILPRTLSRAGEDLSGEPYVLQLSINGLVTALTGRHLGLPNLFHTETGYSGIGRFGLMDGAAMFSYRGLFPPEMSAWEKIYAGWAEPFTLPSTSEQRVELPAASSGNANRILNIPISKDEYYLIENRHRDPDNNGVTITIQRPDGSSVQQTFTNRDTRFTNQDTGFEELLEPGVITSVSNFDFSLPGGLEASGDRELNGGVLIWHVDEAVIRDKQGSTGINNNEFHRAVGLKEADGAQDIGRPVSAGLFQNEINGSPFDFWWAGNNASVIHQGTATTLYQNRFGADTVPANHSHSGTPSFFELSDFSGNLPIASFTFTPVNPFQDLYTPVQIDQREITAQDRFFISDESDHLKNHQLAIIPFKMGQSEGAIIPSQKGLFFLDTDNRTLKKLNEFHTDIRQPLLLETQNQIAVSSHDPSGSDQLSIALYDFTPDTLSLKWQTEAETFNGFLSQTEPGLLDADHSNIRFSAENGAVHTIEEPSQSSEIAGGYQSQIRQGQLILRYPGGEMTHNIPGYAADQKNHTGLIQQGDNIAFYLLSGSRLSYFSEKDEYRREQVLSDNIDIGRPAIADLQQNGIPAFMFIEKEQNQLVAKNSGGALLPGFPITPPAGSEFIGTPLAADIDGDGIPEIIVTVRAHYSLSYYGYNIYGEIVDGFPIMGGSLHPDAQEFIHPAISGNHFVGVSPAGELNVWEFPELTDAPWRSAYGNKNANKITAVFSAAPPPLPSDYLLDRTETYNWPNPASDHTYIRLKTTENAEITLKIITLSGQLVHEENYQTPKGVVQDFEIDTKHWASGGYIGLITAEAGKIKEQQRIQIAIVK